MEMKSSIGRGAKLGAGLLFVVAVTLIGCGAGGNSSANNTPANTSLTPAQIAAITPVEISAYSEAQISAFGTNIKYLSDAALQALANSSFAQMQISAITPVEITALTPAQVRMIGAAGVGGTVGTSKIFLLNFQTWPALVSNPAQVAAITPAEVATLTEEEIMAIGTNFNQLSDAALQALANRSFAQSQITAITQVEIATLTPAQVRMIGAGGSGGMVGTSQISLLSILTWPVLVSNSAQVAAITSAEVATLTPTQILDIAVLTNPFGVATGIANLNLGAFSALSAAQVVGLAPAHVVGVSAAQLASLSTGAIAGLAPATIASLTVTQKASLSVAQHTACAC